MLLAMTSGPAVDIQRAALDRCQAVIESWRGLTVDDFDFDPPKGFSSFTMGIRAIQPKHADLDPPAVLYRHLAGKDNAILDFATERSTFLLLGDARVGARCLHYDDTCRIEEFYPGRTLTADDVFDADIQRGIADELFRLHSLRPANLPQATFFELLHRQWGEMARAVLGEHRLAFPADEQALCTDLEQIYSDATHAKVMRCLPEREPVFCHNDTYHGNVMQLADGSIRLLDFEFSCRNHIAFDFANLFAETVMQHGLVERPHFRIGPRRFDDTDLGAFIGFYLDNADFADPAGRQVEHHRLVAETKRALLLSDYMYAMAALPLALEPIQKIRFLPYAHQRFRKFLVAWEAEFAS
jgi:thiamine kinase-like enzyme